MAIAPAVPGLEVTIEVDNVPLPEHQYADEDEDTTPKHDAFNNSVIKYIEVPSGAQFSVRWLLKEPFDETFSTYAAVQLDGTYLNGPLRETGHRDGARGYKYAMTMSKVDGQVFTQEFRFSELEIGDQTHPTKDLKRQLEGIGTINVYIYYVIGEAEVQKTNVPQLELAQLDPMNEKISQKCAPTLGDVLTHQTSLTTPQVMHSSAFHSVETSFEPFASYTFYYRSTRALKSLGIIPGTPSPSRSPTLEQESEDELDTCDPDTMTREELIAALAKTKTRAERFVRIKREREEDVAAGNGDGEEVVWTGSRPAKKREFVVLDD